MAGLGLDKRKLKREIERERRRKVKERKAELRGLIKEARSRRAERLSIIRDQCRAERKALALSCSTKRERARSEARDAVAGRRKQLGDIDAEERVYREADAQIRKRRGLTTSRERRQESDDEVRSNLPEDLVQVFDAVRRGIKGGPRKSRTESFLQWAEENPGEVLHLQQSEADREVERLIKEYHQLNRAPRRRSAVPF